MDILLFVELFCLRRPSLRTTRFHFLVSWLSRWMKDEKQILFYGVAEAKRHKCIFSDRPECQANLLKVQLPALCDENSPLMELLDNATCMLINPEKKHVVSNVF